MVGLHNGRNQYEVQVIHGYCVSLSHSRVSCPTHNQYRFDNHTIYVKNLEQRQSGLLATKHVWKGRRWSQDFCFCYRSCSGLASRRNLAYLPVRDRVLHEIYGQSILYPVSSPLFSVPNVVVKIEGIARAGAKQIVNRKNEQWKSQHKAQTKRRAEFKKQKNRKRKASNKENRRGNATQGTLRTVEKGTKGTQPCNSFPKREQSEYDLVHDRFYQQCREENKLIMLWMIVNATRQSSCAKHFNPYDFDYPKSSFLLL